MTELANDMSAAFEKAARRSKLIGVLLVILGIAAVVSPIAASASIGVIAAITLIAGGAAQLIMAFGSDRKIANIIVGLLTLVAGAYMLAAPGLAIATLTLVLAIYLIAAGIAEVILALQIKGEPGWANGLWSGALSLLFGVMLWSGFPLSGLVAIGVIIGFRLILSGLGMLFVGSVARKVA